MEEGLSHILTQEKHTWGKRGLQISPTLSISHLLFVDDMLVLCDGTKWDMDKLDQGLKLLKFASGMVIYRVKSSIVTA